MDVGTSPGRQSARSADRLARIETLYLHGRQDEISVPTTKRGLCGTLLFRLTSTLCPSRWPLSKHPLGYSGRALPPDAGKACTLQCHRVGRRRLTTASTAPPRPALSASTLTKPWRKGQRRRHRCSAAKWGWTSLTTLGTTQRRANPPASPLRLPAERAETRMHGH